MTDLRTDLCLGRLDGDGIGPEVTAATVAVVDAAVAACGLPAVRWVPLPVGLSAVSTHGTPLPEETVTGLAGVDGWVMGPHDNVSYPPPFDRQLNPSGYLRRHFDLYANVRPAVGRGVDLVIVRENTQGFYADRSAFAGNGEWAPTRDVAITQALFTRPAIERIAAVAGRVAAGRSGRVTIVHKANVLPLTMGMFRDVCRSVLEEVGGLEVRDLHVDNCAAQLVRNAASFDVIVTENLFGDILSDLAAEVAGSLGTAGAINHGDRHAMAQAVHGAAPDIVGRGIANPTALIRSAALLLRWLAGRDGADPARSAVADRIDAALRSVDDAGVRTPDLGGTATTASFTDAVVAAITAGS